VPWQAPPWETSSSIARTRGRETRRHFGRAGDYTCPIREEDGRTGTLAWDPLPLGATGLSLASLVRGSFSIVTGCAGVVMSRAGWFPSLPVSGNIPRGRENSHHEAAVW